MKTIAIANKGEIAAVILASFTGFLWVWLPVILNCILLVSFIFTSDPDEIRSLNDRVSTLEGRDVKRQPAPAPMKVPPRKYLATPKKGDEKQ